MGSLPFSIRRAETSLNGGYVCGLQPFRPPRDFKFDRLAFVQRFIAVRLNRGEVDENVFAGWALDESESLTGVEPLYSSFFSQGISPSYSGVRGYFRHPRKK